MALTYKWTWDANVFTAGGPINGPSIKLVAKAGKEVTALVSPVLCEVKDIENNCSAVKTCYYTPSGMICDEGFIPCLNPVDLMVDGVTVICVKPTFLTVNLI